MKFSEMSWEDQQNFFVLLRLQRELKYVGYNKLNLILLDDLRREVSTVLEVKYGLNESSKNN